MCILKKEVPKWPAVWEEDVVCCSDMVLEVMLETLGIEIADEQLLSLLKGEKVRLGM